MAAQVPPLLLQTVCCCSHVMVGAKAPQYLTAEVGSALLMFAHPPLVCLVAAAVVLLQGPSVCQCPLSARLHAVCAGPGTASAIAASACLFPAAVHPGGTERQQNVARQHHPVTISGDVVSGMPATTVDAYTGRTATHGCAQHPFIEACSRHGERH